MDRLSRFVVWICKTFDRFQIERIVQELQTILANQNPDVKPKDDLKKTFELPGILGRPASPSRSRPDIKTERTSTALADHHR